MQINQQGRFKMKDQIYHILSNLGYTVLPQYIYKENDHKTLVNLLAFAKFMAARQKRFDLI